LLSCPRPPFGFVWLVRGCGAGLLNCFSPKNFFRPSERNGGKKTAALSRISSPCFAYGFSHPFFKFLKKRFSAGFFSTACLPALWSRSCLPCPGIEKKFFLGAAAERKKVRMGKACRFFPGMERVEKFFGEKQLIKFFVKKDLSSRQPRDFIGNEKYFSREN
jgi:hypothetical protein